MMKACRSSDRLLQVILLSLRLDVFQGGADGRVILFAQGLLGLGQEGRINLLQLLDERIDLDRLDLDGRAVRAGPGGHVGGGHVGPGRIRRHDLEHVILGRAEDLDRVALGQRGHDAPLARGGGAASVDARRLGVDRGGLAVGRNDHVGLPDEAEDARRRGDRQPAAGLGQHGQFGVLRQVHQRIVVQARAAADVHGIGVDVTGERNGPRRRRRPRGSWAWRPGRRRSA